MRSDRRHATLALGALAIVLLAGCVQVGVHSTVDADGTIEEYRVQINTSRAAYGFLEQNAEENGYDSVRESVLSGVDESQAEQIDYEEEFHGDQVTMTITISNFDPPVDSPISITEEDGKLVYEDLTFVNESAEPGTESELARSITATMAVDYYLTMPGEITDSNADEVDGNTAEWHESGAEAFNDNRIYAVSEKPTFAALPGFGVGVAITALLLTVGGSVLVSRKRDD